MIILILTHIHYQGYKVFYLVGHFVLAIQGLLGRCTFVMQIMS